MNLKLSLSALPAALFALILTLSPVSTRATEGMWIPALLQAVEGDMQDMGLKLTAEECKAQGGTVSK